MTRYYQSGWAGRKSTCFSAWFLLVNGCLLGNSVAVWLTAILSIEKCLLFIGDYTYEKFTFLLRSLT